MRGEDGDGDELTSSECVDYGREHYAALIEAGDKEDDPHIIAVLSKHGLHVYENCDVDSVMDVAAGIVVFAFEAIAQGRSLPEAALWLMEVVAACGG